MATATTPTRRPSFAPPESAAAAAGYSSCSERPLFGRRVTLPAGGCGVCSSRTRAAAAASSDLARPAVVAVRGRACACSPTTHPGSFRCALHRGSGLQDGAARRPAMANPLARIAAVEGGDRVRRALAALIRPSPHHQRPRDAFRALPSRLSAMSTAAPCSPATATTP